MTDDAALLLDEIETFLKRSRMSASRFGDKAAGDCHLVDDLRHGREPRRSMRRRVRAFIAGSGTSPVSRETGAAA